LRSSRNSHKSDSEDFQEISKDCAMLLARMETTSRCFIRVEPILGNYSWAVNKSDWERGWFRTEMREPDGCAPA
jgi:hypothetical protein